MAYSIEHTPSNPDATPLYNDNIFKFWNWFADAWNCNDWMTWHKANVSKYGKDHANEVFLHYWNDLATGSHAIDCRSFDTNFRSYMKSVGLLDSLYSGIGIIAKPIGGATEAVTGVSKIFSLLPLLIIIVLIVLGAAYLQKRKK